MRMIILAASAFVLTGCVANEQARRASFLDKAKDRCVQIGHRIGTAAHKKCTERLYKTRTNQAVIEDDLTRERLRRFDYCMGRSAGFGVAFGAPYWGPGPYGYYSDWDC